MVQLLIADDEMIERAVLCKTLRKNLGDQCTIFQAENGREALEIYRKEQIQIALLDIEMPGINGIQAAEAIREKDKDCCIIFLTAYDEFAYAKKAITVRALDYLLKPYDENELMLVLEEAIRLAREQQARRREAGADAGSRGKGGIFAAEAARTGPEAGESPLPPEDPAVQGELAQQKQQKVTQVIQRYIRDNYMYDLSMQDLAQMMNYSEPYFSRLFKQCFGRNFTSYLAEYRVNEAKELLKQPTVNVKEIGKAVGYPDSNYFTKVFRRITGQSPSEYRLSIFRE